ncbi:MAG TPA: PilC/PilY family type IV pilus protein [Candidatus Krumholzibacteria bacterium]|nr:PilC/PilY family type IV pilus protein [Candidatus Krumholzibacteria bacterium]HPD70476.1 PilC/PilY family type IV pilus protein [Candidatus Krumholzibacteria bacterium]HRY39824.1 PilC/PilY family type IV pilus protein [Candidatus Krumholzibacteria bacterium]
MLLKKIINIFCAAALLAASVALGQEICQVPRFVVQGTGEGNVMILADNSGSMNQVIWHTDYDQAIAYPGRFTRTNDYYVSRDGDYSPRSFNRFWESTPVCRLVNSDNGEDGRYVGNYLNWLFYNATDTQRAEAPRTTRIQVLKEVLVDVLDISSRLHFGITVFQNDNGGSIESKCGGNINSIAAIINGITANAWTPTGEAMAEICEYFQGSLPSSPIQSPCIHNFLIVMTDGYPTMDEDFPAALWDADGDGNDPGNCASIGAPYPESNHCTDHMDDAAYYMAHTDLRPDMPDDQFVYTYVIGYDIDAPLLQETADNGGGVYYNANNASELRYSLEWALQDIIRRISAGSAVAVVSTERGYDDRLFRGKFMPVDWAGYLECYSLPYEDGEAPIWEAGAILADRDPASRTIFTALGTDVHDFTTANATDLTVAMGVADLSEAQNLIDWGRGVEVAGYRSRHDWRLGDIVHSTPVVVGVPNEFYATPEYQTFADAHADREKTVYVGANDGMLHAFAAADGEEMWAFVPELALPYFAVMADSFYCHHYTVDQTMTVRDLQLNGTWRTVLVGGSREGGPGLFALDITEPRSPEVLWQTEAPNGASFPSQATLVKTGGAAVAVVGSGLAVDPGQAWLYAFDVESGDLLGSIQLSSINNGRNKATQPAAFDRDVDGTSEALYVGDMLGNLWRIELNDSEYPASWDVTKIFTNSNAPITATPALTFDEAGNVMVFVGTGSYLDDDDMDSTDLNYFYGVIDRGDGSCATLASLVDQTNNIQDIGAADGWYVRLVMDDGERITNPALVAAGNVLVTSFAPSHDACIAGGQSWLYRFYYENGGGPDEGENGEEYPRVESLGDGIASHPVLDLASGNVVIQGSDAVLHVEEVGATFFHLLVRSWQESFDFVTMPSP